MSALCINYRRKQLSLAQASQYSNFSFWTQDISAGDLWVLLNLMSPVFEFSPIKQATVKDQLTSQVTNCSFKEKLKSRSDKENIVVKPSWEGSKWRKKETRGPQKRDKKKKILDHSSWKVSLKSIFKKLGLKE